MRMAGSTIQIKTANPSGRFKGGNGSLGAHFGNREVMLRTSGVDRTRVRAFEQELVNLLRKLASDAKIK